MKRTIFTFLILLISIISFSATITSSGNGEWDDPTTWTPQVVPSSNDTVIISSGDTVLVDCVCGVYDSLMLEIYGDLQFNGGKKLKLTNSIVDVYPGASIFGGNNGTRIEINSVAVYSGSSSPLDGPTTCDSSGCIPNTALPIELISFDAYILGEWVTANWLTASEINNDYFEVQISTDVKEWDPYSIIPGSGNSSEIRSYSTSFIFQLPFGYVRLAQYDYDGDVSYSDIVYIERKDLGVTEDRWKRVFRMNGTEVNWEHGLTPGIYIVVYEGGYFKYAQQ